MKILGLYAMGPNTASCVVADGNIVAFAEEERFTRVKLATNTIPVKSSAYCLKEAGLDLSQIDYITLGWDNNKYPSEMKKFYSKYMSSPKKDEYSRIYEEISLNEKNPIYFNKRIEIAYRRQGYRGRFPPILYSNHHLCHAYSVFYPSPFKQAIIIVIDGSGEENATSVWVGKGNKISLKKTYNLPNSIGFFYAALTEYLGFSVFTGEGKVMGLAPYGRENLAIRKKLNKIISITKDGYTVDPQYIYFDKRSYSLRHTDALVKLLGHPPKLPSVKFTKFYRDVAFETQYKLEQVVSLLVEKAIDEYGIRNICLSGGVASNCKMNGYISALAKVNNCFAMPVSNDAGCALGSALYQSRNVKNIRKKAQQFTPYLGPNYNDEYIKNCLKEFKIRNFRYLSDKNLYSNIASKLAQGQIVGWFQGRMEVGARALGNRSILANPAFGDMKNKINREVKHREPFRPFAPAILAEYAKEYIKIKNRQEYSPYHEWMLMATVVDNSIKSKIPAVVHQDNSIRPQVVSQKSNPKFHALLKAFYKKTGLAVLLNTSFNVRGEPIICKPEEAIRCFYSTGLDAVAIGNYLLEK